MGNHKFSPAKDTSVNKSKTYSRSDGAIKKARPSMDTKSKWTTNKAADKKVSAVKHEKYDWQ